MMQNGSRGSIACSNSSESISGLWRLLIRQAIVGTHYWLDRDGWSGDDFRYRGFRKYGC